MFISYFSASRNALQYSITFVTVPSFSLSHPSRIFVLDVLSQFKGMCLANPSLSPQDACAELERLHDQVLLFSSKYRNSGVQPDTSMIYRVGLVTSPFGRPP